MDKIELKGKIKLVGKTVEVGNNGFKKRELVLETEEQYPQFISINFIKDACDNLNGYSAGEKVAVGINLKGREWTSPSGEIKYFNDIQGWRISKLGSADSTPSTNSTNEVPVFTTEREDSNQAVDDLPF
jgi:single-stranded DNA-binding protein